MAFKVKVPTDKGPGSKLAAAPARYTLRSSRTATEWQVVAAKWADASSITASTTNDETNVDDSQPLPISKLRGQVTRGEYGKGTKSDEAVSSPRR